MINYSLIPDGYEINSDDSSRAKFGDLFIDERKDIVGKANGFSGLTVKEMRMQYSCHLLKKSERKLTPKESAKLFVDTNITNPSEETYRKFEEAFSREDDFGL